MQISENGVKFIKRFEAYLKQLPDGSCTAYQEVLGKKNGVQILDIPTIGWGCTKGVKMGMVWTKEQAESAFREEIAEHEAIVSRVVTVELTQGQYDALVSFNYNCGKLPNSTMLKHINAGKFDKAVAEFDKFVFASGVRMRGLERRRAGEKALFLEPDATQREHTPQQASRTPLKEIIKENKELVAAATTAVAAGGKTVSDTVSAPATAPKIDPKAAIAKGKETRETLEAAKDLGTWAKGFGTWAAGDGLLVCLGLAAVAAAVVVIPKIKERF